GLADGSAALREGRVRRRQRYHDGDVRGRRAAAAADRQAGCTRLIRKMWSGEGPTVGRTGSDLANAPAFAGARCGMVIRRVLPACAAIAPLSLCAKIKGGRRDRKSAK